MFGSFACNFEEEYRGLGSFLFVPNSWQTHRLLFGDRLPGVLLQPLLYTGFESWKADQLHATSIQPDQQRGTGKRPLSKSPWLQLANILFYMSFSLFSKYLCGKDEKYAFGPWTELILLQWQGQGASVRGHCHGTVAVMSQYCHGTIAWLSWYCCDTVSALSKYCLVPVAVQLPYCLATVTVLSRYCQGLVFLPLL